MTKPMWSACLGALLVTFSMPACDPESEDLDERFAECVCGGEFDPQAQPDQIRQEEEAVPVVSNIDPDDDDDDDEGGLPNRPAGAQPQDLQGPQQPQRLSNVDPDDDDDDDDKGVYRAAAECVCAD
jgi:hypothetical protein